MSGRDIQDLLHRLDGLLDQIEQSTGPAARIASQAVEALAAVYGTALARAVAIAARSPELVSSLIEDELVHHLLVLHGIHPWPAEDRIRRALDALGLRSAGGDAELIGVEDGVARVRWSIGGCGCGSSGPAIEQAIRDAVLAAAPELRGVETDAVPAGRGRSAVIPVDAVRRRAAAPAESQGGPA